MRSVLKISVLICVLALLTFAASCSQKPPEKPIPVPEVTITTPIEREVTKYLEYTGNTAALQSVDIRARVPGFLTKITFDPGARVTKGELLFVIDPRQYEAQVQEAQAQVDAKKARAKLSQTEVQISQRLESKEAISALKLEQQVAARDVSLADVELAQAALEKAKLDLEWTQVISPINGRVSRNLVDVGNLVGAAGEKTLLTTVMEEDSVYAYFNITESDLLPLLRRFGKKSEQEVRSSIKVPVFLGLADETGYPHKGSFDFADTKVDPATGTIQTRAIFPNPDGLLMPGLFTRIRVPIDKRKSLLIPEIAVQYDQGGKYVLTLGEDNVVQQKRVTVGEQVDDMRVIEKGLSSTDRVIVSGLLRARPGFKASPTGKAPEAAPQPVGK